MSLSPGQWFALFFLWRYARLVINLFSFWTFRPIRPSIKPTFTSTDATVIIPTLDGDGDDLMATIKSMLANDPYEIILVTIEANERRALAMVNSLGSKRVRVLTVAHPNKRRQMCRAIPEVTTPITIFADDDVFWPTTAMPWILEPFRADKMGGVVTCQRIRRAEKATFVERIWEFLGALYLERRNFDCAATSHIDGGVPCLSGRTCAYRTSILRDDPSFTYEFTNETWWRGRFQLKADDDNFITRWLVNHNWDIYMQYHPECEVQTLLEMNSKYLKQCARWARSNWRSNLTSIFIERTIWRRQPYSTYAVQLTTLAPPALLVEGAIVYYCNLMTSDWDSSSRWTVLYSLFAWMFLSKWIKLIGHYVRFPGDIVLLPVSIMFGYLHGIIKMYAFLTLNVTAWGSREGADANDEERMRRITAAERAPVSNIDWDSWKTDGWDLEASPTREKAPLMTEDTTRS